MHPNLSASGRANNFVDAHLGWISGIGQSSRPVQDLDCGRAQLERVASLAVIAEVGAAAAPEFGQSLDERCQNGERAFVFSALRAPPAL